MLKVTPEPLLSVTAQHSLNLLRVLYCEIEHTLFILFLRHQEVIVNGCDEEYIAVSTRCFSARNISLLLQVKSHSFVGYGAGFVWNFVHSIGRSERRSDCTMQHRGCRDGAWKAEHLIHVLDVDQSLDSTYWRDCSSSVLQVISKVG